MGSINFAPCVPSPPPRGGGGEPVVEPLANESNETEEASPSSNIDSFDAIDTAKALDIDVEAPNGGSASQNSNEDADEALVAVSEEDAGAGDPELQTSSMYLPSIERNPNRSEYTFPEGAKGERKPRHWREMHWL